MSVLCIKLRERRIKVEVLQRRVVCSDGRQTRQAVRS
jgi:hypothetical protein